MSIGAARGSIIFALVLFTGLVPGSQLTAVAQSGGVTIVAPDDGEILDGVVTVQVNAAGATGVQVFYDPHEDDEPEISLGAATDAGNGLWALEWDTRAVPDTFNDLDTNGDGVEDTTVNITKPPTFDQLRVVATGVGQAAIDVRVQNAATVRFTLPDNQEDIRGITDLEAIVTSEFEVTSVRFDLYPISAADPRILTPFGEFQSLGEPIEAAQYGRPLNDPAYPTGSPVKAIGEGFPEGTKRWVLRGWDTTTVEDGRWLLVATATDTGSDTVPPRKATYMVETYIVNDLRVKITAPDPGDTVSRFIALEARTSSLTGADNAAPGSLWPATEVRFAIRNAGGQVGPDIPATEIPEGSGRWRAVWDSQDADGTPWGPGPYTIRATAVNENPAGVETTTDNVDVNLVEPGGVLEAFFPFDWSNCNLRQCSFLDGSSGGPTTWLWDFGDGNTSTEQNPSHTYATYGVYTVTLTVNGTSSYSRDIPVGNTPVVSFNRNNLDLQGATEFIDWTSAFKNFSYTVGSTLAIPVMWETTVGRAKFASLPTEVCDDDEGTSNQECVIFTPEEAFGDAPTVVGAAQDGVLFTMKFTKVQYRGVTDAFKGKANIRIVTDVDVDGNGTIDQQNQLGTNVDVTNTGLPTEARLVKIFAPFENQFVGGNNVLVRASTVSSADADQVEFFVNGESLGIDDDPAGGWSARWNTLEQNDDGSRTYPDNNPANPDSRYELTAVATFKDVTTASAVRSVNVDNVIPQGPAAPARTFQTGRVNDTTGEYITYPFEIEEAVEEGAPGGGGPPVREPTVESSMTAEIVETSIVVCPGGTPVGDPDCPRGGGLIGGDALEFDVILTNTSLDPDAVMTAYGFQSKFSESPALASRIGDKAFYGVIVAEESSPGAMTSVKKNGTSNGLFSGRWKGICINSSDDFLPEFNSGLGDESLECGGNRIDANGDGEPELASPIRGIYPGQSQTVRVRIEAGTTDGALHVVKPGTLRSKVKGKTLTGPNGRTYVVPEIDNAGIASPNVLAIPDFSDNKVLLNADGTFNPTFAPLVDGLTFRKQIYLTLPRVNFAFSDILGRNHTCGTYGLDDVQGNFGFGGDSTSCDGKPGARPVFGVLDEGDLVQGAPNLAAMLHGFGEYKLDDEGNVVAPKEPYDTRCVNLATPDGLRCGARPFTPVAEFYKDNGDGTVTQQMIAGSYGELGTAGQYTATFEAATAEDVKEDVIPEPDPGGPCNPVAEPNNRKPSCSQLRTSATAHFRDLDVSIGTGINGGDQVEFTMDITNTSRNNQAWLTAFNYQTKRRSLADIGVLDGYTQDRRDVRVHDGLPFCNWNLDRGACWNQSLGIGQFPNVIGNQLLFGQMVWKSGRRDRTGQEIIPDFVAVAPNGIDPAPYKLESVKKNGPFTPILKGNVNFLCVKSGLFFPDQDADASCAGVPAILEGGTVGDAIWNPGESSHNVDRRLGLAPTETQSVRVRHEFGDFRGALLELAAGVLTTDNVHVDFKGTGGLARFFDCEDQRELAFCHPSKVGQRIDYLPNSTATWLTPTNLRQIKYVIINQPGNAPRLMNFRATFGLILRMAGFVPAAEFYAPDPNPDLEGTPFEGVLIRQQVMGEYLVDTLATTITSRPVTTGVTGEAYTYDVDAVTYPGTVVYSLETKPSGMTIDGNTGMIRWTPGAAGVYDVVVKASRGSSTDTQAFKIKVVAQLLDDFDRANGSLGSKWGGLTVSYAIVNKEVDVGPIGGPIYWTNGFGANQEVSIELTKLDSRGQHGVLLKGNSDHLKLSGILVSYDAAKKRVVVIALEYGKLPRTVSSIAVTMQNGDVLGAQALADGSLKVLRNSEQIGSTVNVGSFFVNRSGHIGVLYLLAGNAFFDNFRGGRITQ
jgi:PKD repeat protein